MKFRVVHNSLGASRGVIGFRLKLTHEFRSLPRRSHARATGARLTPVARVTAWGCRSLNGVDGAKVVSLSFHHLECRERVEPLFREVVVFDDALVFAAKQRNLLRRGKI